MSTVNTLIIQGIRSYPLDVETRIKFFKPLTLIVGSNGSGKTTIIECLKYALTGSTPSSDKKGFICDLKLNGNKAVQAKVTLEFTPADAYSKRERGATEEGTDMSRDDDDDDDEEEEEGGSSSSSAAAARKKRLIVTRIAELTSSASGRDSFKTKECTFSDIVGTRSTKWSDTNAPLTKWMGVSKPIIENILLCHQEDSLWPLAEGKKLKEKFDEIFSVTKFSANLDSLREAIKVNKKHIAELNMTKDKYEERKKLVDDKKRSIEAETSSMEASQKAISIITTQQKELSELIQSKEPLRKRLEDEKHKYDFLKGRLNGNNKLVQKYKGKSQLELTATERELQSALDNDDTDKKLLKAKSKAKALQDKKIQYERLRTTVSNASSTLSTEKVKLANAISECIKNECFTFILETHKDLVVKGESNFKLFLEKVKEAEAQLATEIKSFQEKYSDQKLKSLELKERSLEMDLKKIEGESSATQRSLSKQEKELERDRKTLDEIYESRDLWDLTTSDLADDAKEHKKAMEEQEVITKAIYDAETEINKTGEEIKIYHQTKENMDAIQGQMTKLAEIAESVKSEAKSKGITLGDDFRLEEGYLEEQYKKYNAEHDMYVKKMITAETVLKANQQAIKEKEEILKRERAKAKALIDKGNDPSTADKFREEAAAAKQYFYNIESLVRIYSKFISDIKSKNECPTCFRKFSDAEHDESRENALRELGGLVEEFNQAKEGACSLDELLAKEKKFWELELKAEPARKILEEVVPKLEDELRKLNEGMTRENIELEEAKRNEKNSLVLKNFYVQCKGLLKDQQNCEKLISILEKKVDKEMYERIDIKSLMKRHDELIETKNKKEGEKSVIQKKLVELEAQIEYNKDRANENKKAESNMVEIEAKIKKSEEEIKNIKACLEKLETESHECEKKKADIKEQVNKEKKIVEAGKKEIEMKTRRLHEIQEARKQGEKYVNTAMFSVKEAESKYTSAKESLSQVKADGLDAEIAHSEQEVEMLSGAVNRRSEIDNELNTVRCLNEFMECCKTIRELNKIFNEDEFEKMVEKQNTLKDSLSKEEGKCESARGRLENLKEELKGIKEHDQIDNKIRDIRIEIIVREKAAADYEMYQKGLDGAIMKYHETQMEEINSVIRDLWQETYCHGNWHEDIDYIKIVSDLDTADGRKSYNYRVVMVKNGKEIGMNGRCSAGQKVLASLVIRMAIAEVFCANCGVFAIDEPSTNLDEHNSVALARALGGLIEKRKSLLSFQLIVITHDQIFTDILGRGYCSGYYYEVSKDKKSGKSTITRKPIEAITH